MGYGVYPPPQTKKCANTLIPTRNESYATGGTPHCGSFPQEESAISFAKSPPRSSAFPPRTLECKGMRMRAPKFIGRRASLALMRLA
eukprot:scaffold1697_cov115-Isochrysis_galbana.AAC.1